MVRQAALDHHQLVLSRMWPSGHVEAVDLVDQDQVAADVTPRAALPGDQRIQPADLAAHAICRGEGRNVPVHDQQSPVADLDDRFGLVRELPFGAPMPAVAKHARVAAAKLGSTTTGDPYGPAAS
ncbi:hypothetical protein CF165_46500 [Amycolatopsis vastitatis]|uniref:Uncharacterized protein n=1 Tax=Amycolatopsis vastitatis TaxID=1905142 RepID=A0A229SLX0_9PSEU|nr:hypothetical protein CF165_46500 [Amycolatopsis vastitatis]